MRARSRRLGGEFLAVLGTNRRLAALLLLIPGIALLHATLSVREAVDATRQQRAPLLARQARLAALADGVDWPARARAERAALDRLLAQLWHADSPELAAADLQTALQRVAATHLSWSQLKLGTAVPLDDIRGWRIDAELTGRMKSDDVLALLQELAEHAPRIRVDGFDYSRTRSQTVTLRLRVFVAPERAP